ncbi:adenosine deaminase [Saccharopolyspora sp. CA-218241]|uniref:adenosine deaminase n=1 Tax=Saccharopolyspora sp. CA-218241 TaxID=3240027 RepID=UPI003D961C3F
MPGEPTASEDISTFIANLPKVDLHVHLLGAASVHAVAALARRHPERGVPADPEALRRYFEFTSFAYFVEVYTAVNRLVTTGEDVLALVLGLGEELARESVRYAEVTVTPVSHLRTGIAPGDLAEALEAGRTAVAHRTGVELNWIVDTSGDDGREGAAAALDWVLRHQPDGTVGFGLGGPESGIPRRDFRAVFRRAVAHGLHSVPHAGETTTAEEVRDAVRELGAERIGHGIRAVDDAALVAELGERGITLEVCPTSNLRTRAVAEAAEHPLPLLRAAGVPVTLGTDDPAMFGTTLTGEYRLCHEELGMSAEDLLDLAETGMRAAFCGESRRRGLLAELDAFRAGAGDDVW